MSDVVSDGNDEEDHDAGLSDRLIESIVAAVDAQDTDRLSELLEPLHPADIADVLEQIRPAERRALLGL